MSSDENNPFRSTPFDATANAGLQLTSGIQEALRSTRPWVLFFAILAIIVAILMGLGGIFFTIVMAAGGAGPMQLVIGGVYLLLAAAYAFPAILLFKYAASIKSFLTGPSTAGLEAAIVSQKAFWRGSGLLVAIVIGLYVLAIVGGLVFAAIASQA